MSYEQLINRIIAADDLHYDESQRRYVSMSPEEVREIVARCRRNGLSDDDLINKYVRWCGELRVGQILHRSFLNGNLRITGFDGEEPRFSPTERTS